MSKRALGPVLRLGFSTARGAIWKGFEQTLRTRFAQPRLVAFWAGGTGTPSVRAG